MTLFLKPPNMGLFSPFLMGFKFKSVGRKLYINRLSDSKGIN